MTAKTDEMLQQLADQLLPTAWTGNRLVRRDLKTENRDRSIYESDLDNLRTMKGSFIRMSRTWEWDATNDGLPYRFFTTPPLGTMNSDDPGELFRAVEKEIPKLWNLVMPDHENADGVLVQPVWRGPALCDTRVINGEVVWSCSQDELKCHARYMRAQNFFDRTAMDEFYMAVATHALWLEAVSEGKVN